MNAETFLDFFAKLAIFMIIVRLCEANQSRPYYYNWEVVFGSLLVAAVPLAVHAVMYLVTAWMLRAYPYGVVRAMMWPIEIIRGVVKSFTKRYPYRKF